IGAVDTLEPFRDDDLHACQPHPFGRPVTGRALAVVGTRDDDQRLLARHVGFDGLPHPRHRALRLNPRVRALLDLAILAHHLVEQLGVGERGALSRQVVTAMGRVRVEVFFRQAHHLQVFPRRAVEHDRVGGRQVIGGDVVRQHRQRTHTPQGSFTGERAFPVRRSANVLQADFFAIGPKTQHIFLDIEANRTGDGIGHHQRGRGEKRLLGVRVNASVEVAVARQYRRGIQITVDDFLLDRGVQGPGHPVAGGAGEGHDAEAQLFQFRGQTRFVQAGGDDVARVAGVGATRDGGDDDRAVRHFARCLQPRRR
nr:hypothetical protein [Tanacetum cinerariifolium]